MLNHRLNKLITPYTVDIFCSIVKKYKNSVIIKRKHHSFLERESTTMTKPKSHSIQ